jgi:hypothetical protein
MNGTTATALDAHWWIACSVDQDVAKRASSAVVEGRGARELLCASGCADQPIRRSPP